MLEHVGRPAGECPSSPCVTLAPASRGSASTALAGATAAAAAAHHDEEAFEDAGREEGGKPVVVLVQPETMEVARRRLEIVAGVERHGLAVRPPERLAIQPEEVLEMARVKVRADSASGPALRDDEQELTGRVRVAREERVAAEPLSSTVGENVRCRASAAAACS